MADLKEAMKSGDKGRVAVIRMARAAIKNAEIAKGRDLDNSEVVDALSKEVKQRNESIDELKKANRPELLEKEEKALSILKDYLPEQMSDEEIAEAARKVIDEVGATTPREKGKVMSELMPDLKGKADGRLISEVIDRLLSEA